MIAPIGHGIKISAMCKDALMDESDNLSDMVETPVDLRPDLSAYGITEYDRGICEDNMLNRTILRKNRLAWRQIYDSNGHASGQIEVISQAMQEGRAVASLTDKKSILKDPHDLNSDYVTGITLLYNQYAKESVPPWIMNATRDYYQIEERRKDNPDKKIRPNLTRYPGRCRFVKSDGIRCQLWHAGRKGDDNLCRTHLGANNSEAGVGAVERARHKAQTLAPNMVDVLEEMAVYATSEPARIQAANSLLDRAGLRPGVDLNVDVQVEVKPAADEVRARLARLREGHKTQEELLASPADAADIAEASISDANGDIIDAEVIEQDAENDNR